MEVGNIVVQRQKSKPDWMLSKFFFDGKEKGVGVEDEKRLLKVKGETAIKAGLYRLGLRNSPKFSGEYFRDDKGNLILAAHRKTPEQKALYAFPHEMIWVLNVENFEYILWHWGNSDDDTDGCYIVGSAFGIIKGQDSVINSRKKYMEIYPIIWRSIMEGKQLGAFVTVLYKDFEEPLAA